MVFFMSCEFFCFSSGLQKSVKELSQFWRGTRKDVEEAVTAKTRTEVHPATNHDLQHVIETDSADNFDELFRISRSRIQVLDRVESQIHVEHVLGVFVLR